VMQVSIAFGIKNNEAHKIVRHLRAAGLLGEAW
jgi:hypothetical protein